MSERVSAWAGAVDRAGVVASAACFVHCLATPIVLSLLSVYAHLMPSEEHIHRVLAVFVASLGGLALLLGYRKHRKKSVIFLTAAGLAFIFGGAFFGDRLPTHLAEVLVTLCGSLCLICAHRQNHTFCKSCRSCCREA